jgi:hypothetical protein
VGAAYRADDGLLAEFLTPYHLALLAGKAVGFFTLFYVGMKALLLSLPKAAGRLAFGGTAGPRAARGAFFKALLIIACVWLPSFVAHFPGTITADGGRVLQQFSARSRRPATIRRATPG